MATLGLTLPDEVEQLVARFQQLKPLVEKYGSIQEKKQVKRIQDVIHQIKNFSKNHVKQAENMVAVEELFLHGIVPELTKLAHAMRVKQRHLHAQNHLMRVTQQVTKERALHDQLESLQKKWRTEYKTLSQPDREALAQKINQLKYAMK